MYDYFVTEGIRVNILVKYTGQRLIERLTNQEQTRRFVKEMN